MVTVDELRRLGLDAGLAAVGVTDVAPFVEVRRTLEARSAAGLHAGMRFTYRDPAVSTEPARLLPDARALVVCALAYGHERPAGPDGAAARIAAYAWRDRYRDLKDAMEVLSARLRADGWRSRIVADDNALVDRAAAHRAGLGWWGRNANLLVPGVGSWVVLGAVATDAPLVTEAATVPDGCGSCRRCLDGCPTAAIIEPGVVDARRCLSWLLQDVGVFPREHRVALGDRIYGCDDCQEVCPPSRRAGERAEDQVRSWVQVTDLLALDDGALLDAVDRWYVPERDVRFVRRNLLVVLGNVGDGSDPAAVEALRRHLEHPDELLRAHAAWAAARIGRHDLLELLGADRSPLVLDELDAVATGAVRPAEPWPSPAPPG